MGIIFLALLSLVCVSSGSLVRGPDDSNTFELVILHNNDMHARFEQTSQLSGTCTAADRDAGKCYGGFARVATVVKEARAAASRGEAPPVLYLNAGDTYTGTAWFTIYKWRIAAELINALNPDAVSLGNHEFDETVNGLVPFLKNVVTPVLAANLNLDNEPELQQQNNLLKSTIISKENMKIGVIGYLTPDTKFLAPHNNVEYEDEVTAIRKEVVKLKSKGVNILIALGHSGFSKDLEIGREVEDIDLVIGGHTNTFLWNDEKLTEKPEQPQGPYPTIVIQKSGRKVPVVQAYAYTKYLGRLHLHFNNLGEIVSVNGKPILLDQNISEDEELLKLITKYRKSVNIVTKEVVGISNVMLNGDCRLSECNLGDFITDSMLHYTKEVYSKNYSDVNIAIVQGGRIRSSIDRAQKPFNVTRGDWITVLPFGDNLCIVTMNGSILLQALEHSIAKWNTIERSGQFLQVSGIVVKYDLSKPPGSRVITAEVACENDLKCTINNNHEYKVIMSLFLANGGDGFAIFVDLPRQILHYDEVTCILNYLKYFSPISPQTSSRISIINKDFLVSSNNNANTSYKLKYKTSVISSIVLFLHSFKRSL